MVSMKKSILSLLALSALFFITAPSLSAQADGNIVVGANDLSIVLPGSYEEYLPLSNPKDVAMNDRFITVADGCTIYVYYRAENVYRAYTHQANADERLNNISALEFSTADGLLYFTDASMTLHIMDCNTLKSSATRLACSSFAICEDTLYYSQVTANMISVSEVNITVFAGDQSINEEAHLIKRLNSTATPAMAISGDSLYYAIGNVLYSTAYDHQTTLDANGNVQDLVFSGSDKNPWYTDSMGTLYHYDIVNNQVLCSERSAYSSVSAFRGNLYLIDGKRVLEYDVAGNAFTDYEICSSSEGNARLSRATDMIVEDDKLIIADRGNRRVSVTDLKTGVSAPFSTVVEPDLIAYTEGRILVTNGSAVAVHDLDGNELYQHTSFLGVIVGVTGVYGSFYFVTGNNYHYSLDSSYTLTDSYKVLDSTAKQLTSDIDGNLYILYLNGNVSRYSELDFMSSSGTNTVVGKFPVTVTKIYTDFAGNVYGMYDNLLYYLDRDLVGIYEFRPDGSVYGTGYTATAYAISYEEKAVYLLCGDFVVKTDVLDVGTLNHIVAGTTGKEIADASTSATVRLLQTRENTVFIAFDESELKTNPYFAYETYYRVKESKTVALLGETNDYYIVSFFYSEGKRYESALVKKEFCTSVTQSESSDLLGNAYVNTPTYLYKYPFPCESFICKSPGLETPVRLERSALVEVVGMLDFGEDFNHYIVTVTMNGKIYLGYIPAPFLQAFNGTLPEATVITNTYLSPTQAVPFLSNDGQILSVNKRTAVTAYGDVTAEAVLVSVTQDGVTYYATVSSDLLVSSTEGRWRVMLILLLLMLAIVIIADFLLLRKK